MQSNFRKILLRFFKECSNYSEMMHSDFAKRILDLAEEYGLKAQNPIDKAGCWSNTVEGHNYWQTMATKICVFMLRYQQEYDIDKHWLRNMTANFKYVFYNERDRIHYKEMDKLFKKMFNSEMTDWI